MNSTQYGLSGSLEDFFNSKNKAVEVILHFLHRIATGHESFSLLFPLAYSVLTLFNQFLQGLIFFALRNILAANFRNFLAQAFHQAFKLVFFDL
ncbi:hypothetical protein D3C76_1394720 [compost metagenome]